MTFAYISDHADAAVDRLLEFYKSKPNVVGLVRAFAGRAQVIEDQISQLSTGTLLQGGTTQGAQLDAVGAIVGIGRNGTTDAVYQLLILGTISKNYSTGSLAVIQSICQRLYQTQQVYISTPNAPGHSRVKAYAELNISIGNPQTDPALFPLILSILEQALPVGVRLVYLSTFTGQALAPDGPQGWDAGFSDLSGNGGGNLAAIAFQA